MHKGFGGDIHKEYSEGDKRKRSNKLLKNDRHENIGNVKLEQLLVQRRRNKNR